MVVVKTTHVTVTVSDVIVEDLAFLAYAQLTLPHFFLKWKMFFIIEGDFLKSIGNIFNIRPIV